MDFITTFRINNETYDVIRRGEKTISVQQSIRVWRLSEMDENEPPRESSLEPNDVVAFVTTDNQTLLCRVLEITRYNSITELLLMEGNKHLIPDLPAGTNEATELYAIRIQYLYDPDNIWEELFEKAREVLNPRNLSSSVSAGGVAAAILSDQGNIYTGVCMDTDCSMGMCAERNALSTMITQGEQVVEKVVCIGGHENIMMPCGVCREFMMQVDPRNKYTQFLEDRVTEAVITLEELLPHWWK